MREFRVNYIVHLRVKGAKGVKGVKGAKGANGANGIL